MVLFSETHGHKAVRDTFQKEAIDEHLKNALWNASYVMLIQKPNYIIIDGRINFFKQNLWTEFFHQKINYFNPGHFPTYLENWFSRDAKWYEIYDFIQFIAESLQVEEYPYDLFTVEINLELKKYMSAYRFVKTKILEITSEEEIAEIEIAANSTINEISEHVKQALTHLSNRENPDYRNSIKESISAIECLCRKITEKNTLGKALNKLISKGVDFNSQFKEGLEKIYSYTNGEDGIRHALMNKPNLDLEDARFMLVMCSSFVNYFIEKAIKAGIEL